MKNNNIPQAPIFLKTSLDILFLLLMIGVISFSLLAAYFFYSGESFPIRINNMEVTEFNSGTAIGVALALISNFIFLLIIWNFRKLVRLFFKRKLFTAEQVRKTKLIGQLSIIVAVLEPLTTIMYNLFAEGHESTRVSMKFGGEGFGSFWFILALGLFFIYLSRIFENARMLKEENELTV